MYFRGSLSLWTQGSHCVLGRELSETSRTLNDLLTVYKCISIVKECLYVNTFIIYSSNLVAHQIILEVCGPGKGGHRVKILLLPNFLQWILP